MKSTKPPAHLSGSSQGLYSRIVADYALTGDDAALTLLRLHCEALDRCEAARQQIESEGAVVKDRFGCPRAHPAVQIERDARLAAARLLREMALDPSEGTAPNNYRPPATKRR